MSPEQTTSKHLRVSVWIITQTRFIVSCYCQYVIGHDQTVNYFIRVLIDARRCDLARERGLGYCARRCRGIKIIIVFGILMCRPVEQLTLIAAN